MVDSICGTARHFVDLDCERYGWGCTGDERGEGYRREYTRKNGRALMFRR